MKEMSAAERKLE